MASGSQPGRLISVHSVLPLATAWRSQLWWALTTWTWGWVVQWLVFLIGLLLRWVRGGPSPGPTSGSAGHAVCMAGGMELRAPVRK